MTSRRVVPEHEVLLHLAAISGPATTAELLAAARRAGAPSDVLLTLEQLPDRQWASVEDAAAALGTGWDAAGGPADDHADATAPREGGPVTP